MLGSLASNAQFGCSYSSADYPATVEAEVQMTMFLGRGERTGPAGMKTPAQNVVGKTAALVAAVDSVHLVADAAH